MLLEPGNCPWVEVFLENRPFEQINDRAGTKTPTNL